MAFNWTLANTAGFKTIMPGVGKGGKPMNADVLVSRLTKGQNPSYRISFSKQAAMKITDDYVVPVLSPAESMLFIVPANQHPKDNGYTFKAPSGSSKGCRPYFEASESVIGDLKKFIGKHDLHYSEDYDGYYILPTNYKEATA